MCLLFAYDTIYRRDPLERAASAAVPLPTGSGLVGAPDGLCGAL